MKSTPTVLHTFRLLAFALVFVAGVMLGTMQSFAGKAEEDAAMPAGKAAKTVFVGASKMGKRDRAAKKMTEQHENYAKEGWTVVNVAVYTENNDLEGFFVTYVKQ